MTDVQVDVLFNFAVIAAFVCAIGGMMFVAARWARRHHDLLRDELLKTHDPHEVDKALREAPQQSLYGFLFGSIPRIQEVAIRALALIVVVGVGGVVLFVGCLAIIRYGQW